MKKHFIKALAILFLIALTLPACAPQVTEIPVVIETATTVPPESSTT